MVSPEQVREIWARHIKSDVEATVNAPVSGINRTILAIEQVQGRKPAYTIANFVLGEAHMIAQVSENKYPNFPNQLIIDWYPRIPRLIMMALEYSAGINVVERIATIDASKGHNLSASIYAQIHIDLSRTVKMLEDDETGLKVINEPEFVSPTLPLPKDLTPYMNICDQLNEFGEKKIQKSSRYFIPPWLNLRWAD